MTLIMQVVPTLMPLYNVLPSDSNGTIIWGARKVAMQYAHNVFATDPLSAKHFDSRMCRPSGTRVWNDFDRFEVGQCLAFSAQIVSSVSAFLAAAPGIDKYLITLTINSTMVSLWQGSSLVAKSTMPLGVAPGMPGLVGDFWICLTDASSEAGTSMQFQYGRGDITVLDESMPMSLSPKYFSFGCNEPVSFVTIGVYDSSAWRAMVKMTKLCFIDNCLQYKSKTDCVCIMCVKNFNLADSGRACAVDPKCRDFLTFSKITMQLLLS
jgi:hypothetical protein